MFECGTMMLWTTLILLLSLFSLRLTECFQAGISKPFAARKSVLMASHMEDPENNGNRNRPPDVEEEDPSSRQTNNMFTFFVNIRINELANLQRESAAREAYEILRCCPAPDSVTYNTVLKAYSKARLPYEAQNVLDEMEQEYMNQMIWAEQHEEGYAITIQPDVASYSAVIHAFCLAEEPSNARATLDRMERIWQQTGNPFFRPTEDLYKMVMAGYSKINRPFEVASWGEKALQKLDNQKDVGLCNAVMQAWARSSVADPGERAERIMRELPEGLEPNLATYAIAIDAWCRSAAPDRINRALSLLSELEQKSKTTRLQPSDIVYNFILKAYGEVVDDPSRGTKSIDFIKHMIYASETLPNAKPTIVSYNIVLNTLAMLNRTSSVEGPELLKVLHQQLKDSSEFRLDEISYGTLVKACSNVLSDLPDTPDFCRQVFREACEAGYVSTGVCFEIFKYSKSILHELLPSNAIVPGTDKFIFDELPYEWVQNCHHKQTKRGHGKRKNNYNGRKKRLPKFRKNL